MKNIRNVFDVESNLIWFLCKEINVNDFIKKNSVMKYISIRNVKYIE